MRNMQKQDYTPVPDATNASVQLDKRQCLRRCTPVFSTIDASVQQSPMQPTRKCICCQRELPVNAFYSRDKSKKPDSYCKECRKVANRIRRKADDALMKEENSVPKYPVITNIHERDVRLQLILHALQTVHENMDRKRRKQREKEYSD